MRNILLITMLITSLCFAQNKAIVPKSGTIVFEREQVILDAAKYKKSIQNLNTLMISKLKNEYFLDRSENGEYIDTLQFNEIIKNIPKIESFTSNINNDIIKIHHVFDNEKIKFFTTENNNTVNSLEINTKEFYENPAEIDIQNNLNIKNEAIEYDRDYNFKYSKNRIIEIIEHKNERKIINGYDCFKVVYSFKESHDELVEFVNFREIWVTNKIKTLFHPVIMEKKILEKYYPLQVIEYSNLIEGLITVYKLSSYSINKN